MPEAIAKLTLERFRVFRKRVEIPIGKLTILAGANSSGKSSAMLAALLLKQTLDAPFDPGPLLLSGGHASIASFESLRSRHTAGPVVLGVETTRRQGIEVSFDRDPHGEIAVTSMRARGARGPATSVFPTKRWRGQRVARVRFMLGAAGARQGGVVVPASAASAAEALEQILHVPGLRSPPQRDYPVTAVGPTFEGRFDHYVASILIDWQRDRNLALDHVATDLRALGLTWKVAARRKSDTHVAIDVGRLPRPVRGGAKDVVEIADVGVGVSQALPVLVALHQARQGQLVYVEQPELHLHPRAQATMGRILVNAASRGVRVVVETHSSLLLLGIQSAIAEGDTALLARDVWLHWFSRNALTGDAEIASHVLRPDGAIPNVPIDFDEVELAAQSAYLDAIAK